jgi:hypothetical protein
MSARLRTVLAATAGGVVLLAGPAFAVTPTPDCHGLAVTDAAGDQFIAVSTTNVIAKPTTAIDITGVFLNGSAGSETLNIRISDLTNSPNTVYTFRWDDPVNVGWYYELRADFIGSNAATGTGFYSIEHGNSSTFSITSSSGRSFAGANGVIQFDKPSSVTWPTTFTTLSARAEQYEGNSFFAEVPAQRVDTASATSWTQPC